MDAEELVERPEMQLGVLVDEAVADALAIIWWQDQPDLERFPSCCAHGRRGAPNTASGGASILKRVPKRCHRG